jgi:hypothetical protein
MKLINVSYHISYMFKTYTPLMLPHLILKSPKLLIKCIWHTSLCAAEHSVCTHILILCLNFKFKSVSYLPPKTLIMSASNKTSVCVCVCVYARARWGLFFSVILMNSYNSRVCEVSDLSYRVAKVLSLLGCYVAYVGTCLPTFRDSVSVPS